MWLLPLLAGVTAAARPNILLVITDDQDIFLGGTEPLARARALLADRGAVFNNAFATTPICCPSRASILTGRYQHNTAVRNNSAAGGCSGQQWRDGLETKTFAAELKSAGYRTMYAGKYLNQYGRKEGGGVEHVPPGWDWWAGLVGNSKYYNYTLSINGKAEHHGDNYTRDYLTDVIRRKAVQFLSHYRRAEESSPFLMVLAPPACHAPFTSAPQFSKKFANRTAPRTKAFNRNPSKDPPKHWLLRTKPAKMSDKTVAEVDRVFRARWQTLLSVDRLVEKVVHALSSFSLLDNTYILLTSDHGYHLGQFAMPLDKRLPYEFDIRIPFWLAGPNISAGQVVETPVLSIDIAPTLLNLAGLTNSTEGMDGLSVAPLVTNTSQPGGGGAGERDAAGSAVLAATAGDTDPILNNYTGIQGRHDFLVEYEGEGSSASSSKECASRLAGDLANLSQCSQQFDCKCQDSRNNTYTCLRSLGQENTMFCRFEDSEQMLEMYNLNQDRHQLTNLASMLTNDTIAHYLKRMTSLSKCRGMECNNL